MIIANEKKENYKPGPMTEGKRNIIRGLPQKYIIESAVDIQEALKDLLSGTIKEMMQICKVTAPITADVKQTHNEKLELWISALPPLKLWK